MSPGTRGHKRRLFTSLRAKLLLTFVLLILLPILAIGVGTTYLGFRDGKKQAYDRLDSVGSLKVAEIENWTNNLQTDLLGLAEEGLFDKAARLLSSYDDSAVSPVAMKILARFHQVIDLSQRFDELFLVATDGRIILSTDPFKVGEYRGLQPYFQKGLRAAGVHVQTVAYSSTSEGLNNVVAVFPVVDMNGETLGVVCGQANQGFLNTIMGERTGLGETGETYLVAANSVLMTVSRFPGFARNTTSVQVPDTQKRFQETGKGRGIYYDYRGIHVVGVYYWLDELDVVLLAEQNIGEAFFPVYFSLAINAAIAVLAAILAAVVGLVFTRSISRPITRLSQTANNIAKGDLELKAQVDRVDEIGSLALSFNAMTARLKHRIAMETIVSSLSKEFINMAATEIDQAIDRALEEICRFVGADRSYVFLFYDDQTIMSNTHEWCQKGIEPQIDDLQGLLTNSLPWFMASMGEEQMVVVEDVQELPPQAAAEKEEWGRQNIKSLLCVSLVYAKQFKGFIGFDSVRRKKKWSREDIQLLRMAGESICNALERSKSEQEQKRLEDQLRQSHKMQAVGTLAEGIAHDFNNLLQMISGQVQLSLMRKSQSKDDVESLASIDQAVSRASDLVKRLLTFSRGANLIAAEVNLNAIIENTLPLLQRTIPKMVAIETSLSPELADTMADPSEIEQIIMNLAANAADAMPTGGRLIIETENVYLSEEEQAAYLEIGEGKYVLLKVSDTGEGMDEETVKHIFEPFYTTKEVGKGTGLGLSIVFGIVRNHHGMTTCSSRPGQGTTFKVYLPAVERTAQTQEWLASVAEPLPTNQRPDATILVVDDEKMILQIAREVLETKGYTVFTAKSGEEAVQIYQEKSTDIDLVTLDLGMPGMGGELCLAELLKIDPKVKVIVASGYSAHKMAKEPEQYGAAAFLSKPYRFAEMLATLQDVLAMNEEKS